MVSETQMSDQAFMETDYSMFSAIYHGQNMIVCEYTEVVKYWLITPPNTTVI